MVSGCASVEEYFLIWNSGKDESEYDISSLRLTVFAVVKNALSLGKREHGFPNGQSAWHGRFGDAFLLVQWELRADTRSGHQVVKGGPAPAAAY